MPFIGCYLTVIVCILYARNISYNFVVIDMENTDTISQKLATYAQIKQELEAILGEETHFMLKMSTVVAVLRQHFGQRFFWCGFYVLHKGALQVSAYQGTPACLHISLDRGICGRAARERKPQIVDDVHADAAHIACDSRSNSELVLPVFDCTQRLIAVLDIDSTEFAAFDQTDAEQIADLLAQHFSRSPLLMHYEP